MLQKQTIMLLQTNVRQNTLFLQYKVCAEQDDTAAGKYSPAQNVARFSELMVGVACAAVGDDGEGSIEAGQHT